MSIVTSTFLKEMDDRRLTRDAHDRGFEGSSPLRDEESVGDDMGLNTDPGAQGPGEQWFRTLIEANRTDLEEMPF